MKKGIKFIGFVTSTTLILILGGCSKEAVKTYEIPKEHSKATIPGQTPPHNHANAPAPAAANTPPAMTATAGMAKQAAAFEAPTMTAPENWEAQPLGSMRKGSWKIKGREGDKQADMSVLVFPGDVGGDLANVNRWRNQIGLAPLSAETLSAELAPIKVESLEGRYITMVNEESGQGIQAVMLPRNGNTWFFKMMGPADIIEAEKEGFIQLVETTTFPK